MISVIIPARNEAARIGQCLASLTAQSLAADAYEVLVVDNGSDDDTAAIAARSGAQVILMPNGTVSALRNRAAQIARGSVLAFIDADCVAAPNWLAGGVAALADGGVAVGNLYDLPSDASWIEELWCGVVTPKRWRTQELWSGNLIVPRAAFELARGFDESLVSSEDVVLSHALCRQGPLFCDERVRVTHIGGPRNLRAFARQQLWHGFEALTLFRYGISRGTFGPTVAVAIAYGVLLAALITPVPNRLATFGGGVGLLLAAAIWHSVRQLLSATDRSVKRFGQFIVLNVVALTAQATAMVLRAVGLRWSGRPKSAVVPTGDSQNA